MLNEKTPIQSTLSPLNQEITPEKPSRQLSKSEIPQYTVDDLLEKYPVGLYQQRLLLICGLAFMCDSLEVNLLSFISICAADDWNLSDAQEASITGIVFAGVILGGGFWGWLATAVGRRIAFLGVCIG